MGQYYRPVFLSTINFRQSDDNKNKVMKSLCPYHFDNGAKLMEHSYVGNSLVQAACHLLATTFSCTRFVWAGDYADNEDNTDRNLYMMSDDYLDDAASARLSEEAGKHVYRYVINHSKKLFVDVTKVKADEYGYRIHPLPLLCAEGNGRGGGDYNGSDMSCVGLWARDVISVSDGMPLGYDEVDDLDFRKE